MSRWHLISRDGCTLCDEMHDELLPWIATEQATLAVIDVDADPILKRRYGYRVPVLLLDGEPVCFGHVDWPEIRRLWALPSHR